MTQEEYYEILKEKWGKVNKESREQIHEYNVFARELRHMMDEKFFENK